jgi:hypothetical protein
MSLLDVSTSLGSQGQPRMKAICDDCERDEVFANPRGDEGKARKKIQQMGWEVAGKSERCPACRAKRKAQKMAARKPKPVPVAPASDALMRQPTRAQRREIMGLLEVSYDVEAERYSGHETDETIATVLNVLPGWVSAIREEFFGAAGGNDEIAALQSGYDDLAGRVADLVSKLAEVSQQASDISAQLTGFEGRLSKVQKAVGERAMARARG